MKRIDFDCFIVCEQKHLDPRSNKGMKINDEKQKETVEQK